MINVRDVHKSFNSTQVLSGVSFELQENSSLVIQGPSGSGKTTLLRLVAGLDHPDSGEIHINGQICSRPGWGKPPNERGLGFVFQSSALWPHMTIAQNISFGILDRPKAYRQKTVTDLLNKFGIPGMGNRFPGELSGGEARRVEIARAVAPKPKYLLMDEPLIHLDPDLKSVLLDYILAIRETFQISLLYITHDPHEAELISTNQFNLFNGKLHLAIKQ